MGEVIRADFGAKKEMKADDTASVPREESKELPQSMLWGRLSADMQERFVRGLNSTAISGGVSKEALEEQRRVVRGWSDENVLEFLGNNENWAQLSAKPALLAVLFERVSGKI